MDLVICLYSMYHLIRNPKNRPAGSSTSYHFFALITDGGFIPLYVFTVLMARRNADMTAGDNGRWRTMFPTDADTDKVLMSTWIVGIAAGSLHLLSTFLDMYMALVFRKISKLPPDMNPLEDNLTSRRKSKHKHKNSSISVTTPLTEKQEKHLSDQTTIFGDRNSKAESYIYSDISSPTKDQIEFLHTRNNSDTIYSPHTPTSARESRERFSMYQQSASARQSRKSLNHRNDLLDDDDGLTLAQRKAMLSSQANIKRHSRAGSQITYSSKNDFYTPPSTSRNDSQEATGDLSLQRNSQQSLKDDNWFVQPELDDGHDDHDHDHEDDGHTAPTAKQSMFASATANKGYSHVTTCEEVSDYEDEANEPMMPHPLRMNPPSPAPSSTYSEPPKADPATSPSPAPEGETLRTQPSSVSSMSNGDNPEHSGTLERRKSRYYGNLEAATAGVRNSRSRSPLSPSPTKEPASPVPPQSSFRRYPQQQQQQQPNHFPSATRQYATNNTLSPSNNASSPVPTTPPFSLHKKSYTSIKRTGEANYTPVKRQSPRVISRSGVDYAAPFNPYDDADAARMPGMMGRRRDVSGKIAEEGRGGAWGASGIVQRKVSGVAQAY